MKVVTTCQGRFSIFDQARELHRHNMLHRLICDYPKFLTRRWDIPDTLVTSFIFQGLMNRAARRAFSLISGQTRQVISRSLHQRFGRLVCGAVPRDTDVVIGLSCMSLELIRQTRSLDIPAIVQHGSFHQKEEHELCARELTLHNLPQASRSVAQWVIDREDLEFAAADHIFVPSQAVKASLKRAGIAEEKIFVNPYGVNLTLFKPQNKQYNPFRIIHCGGLHVGKGVHHLVQAFYELNLKDAELWLIGAGRSSPFAHTLRKRFPSKRIIYKGTYPQSELPKLYNQGSLFSLCSLADGFAMVVPQALACGLPVLLSDRVGAASLIDDGKQGYLFPAGDTSALKARIMHLYENPELCIAMGAAARQCVESGLSWKDYGERLARFLKEHYAA